MADFSSESFRTISTVRTFLAVIMTLLVVSLCFQWASINALRDEQREILAWIVDTRQKLVESGFDVAPIKLRKDQDEERRRHTD